MNYDFDEINKVHVIKRKKTSIELIKENFIKNEKKMNEIIDSNRNKISGRFEHKLSNSHSNNNQIRNFNKIKFDYELIDTSYEKNIEKNNKLSLYQAKLDKQRKKPKNSIFSNIQIENSNKRDPKSQKSSENLYVFDPTLNHNIKVNNHSSANSITKNILRTITSTIDSNSLDENNYFNNESSLKRRSGIKRSQFDEELRDNLIYYDKKPQFNKDYFNDLNKRILNTDDEKIMKRIVDQKSLIEKLPKRIQNLSKSLETKNEFEINNKLAFNFNKESKMNLFEGLNNDSKKLKTKNTTIKFTTKLKVNKETNTSIKNTQSFKMDTNNSFKINSKTSQDNLNLNNNEKTINNKIQYLTDNKASKVENTNNKICGIGFNQQNISILNGLNNNNNQVSNLNNNLIDKNTNQGKNKSLLENEKETLDFNNTIFKLAKNQRDEEFEMLKTGYIFLNKDKKINKLKKPTFQDIINNIKDKGYNKNKVDKVIRNKNNFNNLNEYQLSLVKSVSSHIKDKNLRDLCLKLKEINENNSSSKSHVVFQTRWMETIKRIKPYIPEFLVKKFETLK